MVDKIKNRMEGFSPSRRDAILKLVASTTFMVPAIVSFGVSTSHARQVKNWPDPTWPNSPSKGKATRTRADYDPCSANIYDPACGNVQ